MIEAIKKIIKSKFDDDKFTELPPSEKEKMMGLIKTTGDLNLNLSHGAKGTRRMVKGSIDKDGNIISSKTVTIDKNGKVISSDDNDKHETVIID